METQNFILDQGREGQPVEQLIDPIEDRPLVIRVFLQFLGTLVLEAKVYIDLAILMVASNQMHLLGIDALQS